MAKFEVYKDKAGEFRWRFVATNGRIIAVSSEGYKSKNHCTHGIDLILTEGKKAPVEDIKK
ncbi:DUF1508 domain-containing protein [Telmatocola sphagniphila]|uniref:DUF1508 domain-containing protein n=1 Tax=Telmatocola sphagniphila TaxID=1123043 RepID=A0A8E6ETA5_9BACT|nr:DUF1508 domain-containing protein [Telmatocola sphagniphila]QVL29815.1 DUF1508 domain-containing protein [Telmatocola sphagniphila]